MCAGADSGLTSTDAIGVLSVDATGKLKEEKAGARSTGKRPGIGAAHFLLGPDAIGIGVLGGAAAWALHHKGLGLTDSDRERIGKELTNGKAAVGVLTPFNEPSMITAKLGELGGTSEEQSRTRPLRPTSKPTSGSRRTAASDAGPPGAAAPGRRAAVPSKNCGCRTRTWPIQRAAIAAKPPAPYGECW